MYTPESLIDVHDRTHRSLAGLLDHAAGFEPGLLARPVEGFGYPTILEQLQHAIGAERYWVGVLHGEMLVDEDEADRASVEALRAFRARVAARTRTWLEGATSATLNTPQSLTTWGGHVRELVPAHVILRTQSHVFQHQGQVAAMCRLLGRPIPPGLDFPLQP